MSGLRAGRMGGRSWGHLDNAVFTWGGNAYCGLLLLLGDASVRQRKLQTENSQWASILEPKELLSMGTSEQCALVCKLSHYS